MFLLNNFGYKEIDIRNLKKIANANEIKRNKILKSLDRLANNKDNQKNPQVIKSRGEIRATTLAGQDAFKDVKESAKKVTTNTNFDDVFEEVIPTKSKSKLKINKKLLASGLLASGLLGLGTKKLMDRKKRKDKGVLRGKYKR